MTDELFDIRPRVNKLPLHSDGEEKGRFPSWLHRKMPTGAPLFETQAILRKHNLNTVCEEAKCPNRFECYSNKTATFLALGKQCTRNCGFCAIDFSKAPKLPDPQEPHHIALAVQDLGLEHVVITMVARDDLPDGGSTHLVAIIREVRRLSPGVTIEVLTSDFSGNFEAIDLVLEERPDVFNHNIETVRSLTPRVRHKATYERTLELLSYVKQKGKGLVKSGLMLGLGEREDEVEETIKDLHHVGCSIITMGQYLQATDRKLLVKDFITPDQFKKYEEFGLKLGVAQMVCGPFVRSSYHAHEFKQIPSIGV